MQGSVLVSRRCRRKGWMDARVHARIQAHCVFALGCVRAFGRVRAACRSAHPRAWVCTRVARRKICVCVCVCVCKCICVLVWVWVCMWVWVWVWVMA